MISREFLKSSAVYSIVGGLPLAWSVILLPFYTSLLTPADYANFALYTGFSTLAQILVTFGLDSYALVHYVEFRQNFQQQKQYIGMVLTTLLAVGGGFILFSCLFGAPFFRFAFPDASLVFFPYGLMSVLTAVMNSLFKTFTTLLIYQQRLKRFFWANICNFIFTLAISLIGLYLFPYTLIGPMWGRLLSGVIIFVIALYWLVREFGFVFARPLIKDMFCFCSPLLIYFILTWMLSYADRFIVNHFLSKEDVAVFDFAIKCAFLLEFLQTGLANSIYPKVFAIWKSPDVNDRAKEVNRYFHTSSAISLLAIPLFVLLVPLVVPLVVTNVIYYRGFEYLLILGLGYAVRATHILYLAPFSLFKKNRLLPLPTLLSALFQLALTVIGTVQWGLIGAVWANLIAKIGQTAFLSIWGAPLLPTRYNKFKMIVLPAFYIAAALALDQMIFLDRWLRHSIIAVVAAGLVFFFYRREIFAAGQNFKGQRRSDGKAVRQRGISL